MLEKVGFSSFFEPTCRRRQGPLGRNQLVRMRHRSDGLVDHDDGDARDEEERVGHREAEAADRREVLGLPEAGGGHRSSVCHAQCNERLLVFEDIFRFLFRLVIVSFISLVWMIYVQGGAGGLTLG